MRVLQGIGYLLHRRDNHRKGDQAAVGVAAPQRAIGGIVHHQERHAFLHIEIEYTDDPRMRQHGDGLGFLLEMLGLLLGQMRMQYLDGRLLIEPHMLSQVHLGIATLSQQADQAVVAKLLSKTVCHLWPPNLQPEARIQLQVDLSFR